MRSRSSSSKQSAGGNNGGSMVQQIEKLKKIKEEPHLSGAYIRSLVKQLTSSRTNKDHPMNPKLLQEITTTSDGSDIDHHHHHHHQQLPQNDLNKFSTTTTDHQTHHSQQPQQPKKQVRRRLHTSRPYQERLLNMAEARREIVTALKFHRAAMKQANEQQQTPPIDQSLQNPSSPTLEPEQERTKCRRNPRIYPSNTNNNSSCSNYLENLSYSSSFSCPNPPLNIPPNPFFCSSSSCSSISPTLPIIDNLNLNLTLPNQPLGLNLNFHDFNNLDTTTLYYNNNNTTQFSIYSYSSPSSSSSPTLGTSAEEAHSFVTSSPPDEEPSLMMMTDMTDSGGLHPMMDDDEMAEIRWIGEQHEMEWNDTLNLVTSAWWFKFLKKMEISPDERKKELEKAGLDQDEHYGFNNNLFDEVMEFPAWMNANNESSFFLQQHLDDYYSEDYLQEPALPCMDIGEIDGMDGEWLV